MFTIITGAQFGDEGKGKIVDLISKDYDLVVRFQGGDNAGHTVKVKDNTYQLHLLPSAFLLNSRVLIGPGIVLNPTSLDEELSMLKKNGVSIDSNKLGIDAKTSIIMPYHIELDILNESKRSQKIGTTKKGIGFAYIDKVARDEITFADITDKNRLMKRLEEVSSQKKLLIKELGGDPSIVNDQKLIDTYLQLGSKFKSYITDVSFEINTALKTDKNVLAEGAQGTHLDVIHGTQKFVTSSSTIAGSACSNLGVGPTKVDNVLGIVKAYITRVGEGPLPTELKNNIGKQIQQVGAEFGTTTGRARRCGWFDLPLLRKSTFLNGYTELSLTKLDVLSNIDPLKICIGYELDGKTIDYPPELTSELDRCKPIYKELSGWIGDLSNITRYSDLPLEAQKYIEYLEENIGVNINYISVGPGREQTFRK